MTVYWFFPNATCCIMCILRERILLISGQFIFPRRWNILHPTRIDYLYCYHSLPTHSRTSRDIVLLGCIIDVTREIFPATERRSDFCHCLDPNQQQSSHLRMGLTHTHNIIYSLSHQIRHHDIPDRMAAFSQFYRYEYILLMVSLLVYLQQTCIFHLTELQPFYWAPYFTSHGIIVTSKID